MILHTDTTILTMAILARSMARARVRRLGNAVVVDAPPAAPPPPVPKVERNEPCPCGSGKKYKKCCLT